MLVGRRPLVISPSGLASGGPSGVPARPIEARLSASLRRLSARPAMVLAMSVASSVSLEIVESRFIALALLTADGLTSFAMLAPLSAARPARYPDTCTLPTRVECAPRRLRRCSTAVVRARASAIPLSCRPTRRLCGRAGCPSSPSRGRYQAVGVSDGLCSRAMRACDGGQTTRAVNPPCLHVALSASAHRPSSSTWPLVSPASGSSCTPPTAVISLSEETTWASG